ncbi:MAG: glyoxalase superfamily protein [Candidatus Saccharimonadales bacterium]
MKLELVPVPVTDVDRAIDFYVNKAGFVLDHDHHVSDQIRFVQLTPPESACSIVLGLGITEMTPGSQQGLQMVVDSAQEAHDELTAKGVEMSQVEEMPWGIFTGFTDPDGNTWALQEMVPQPAN